MRTFLTAAAVLLFTAGVAQATPILAGDSNSSTFSNLTCTSCTLTSLSSKTLTVGSTQSPQSSTLSIVNTSFSSNGSATGVQLAQLSMTIANKPGVGQTGIGFDYNLVLSFSTPIGSTSQIFNLHASGDGGNGAAADFIISGLSPLTLPDPLVMSNVTLSNFHFATAAGDAGSVFTNGTWDGSGNATTHSLFLLADVTDTTPVVRSQVPEPMTLGLFGAGLLGAGALRRRKKSA